VLLVGGGNVGLHLARKLAQDSPGLTLKIIELNRERAAYCAAELGSKAVVLQGDALDRHILEEAQFASAETIIAVTNDDETNIFVSVLAKQAGCARAVTLVNKRSYESLMPTLGIDAVVSPSAITISTILRHVRRSEISALYNLREDFGEVVETELQKDSAMVGSQLSELSLPSGMRIGAVVRGSKVHLDGEAVVLQPGDRIIALITYPSLKKAEAVLTARRRGG
jgi:trk system potassium uptake protein TrkA